MRCLLEALRGEAGSCAVPEPEWEDAVLLAEEHRVLPFLAETLLQSAVELPPPIHARLTHARREALHFSFLQISELRHILGAFAQADIPVLPLKGPFLAQRIYGAAALRISCDHDLLVSRTDFKASTQLLQTLGFVPDALPDDYHGKWSRGATVVELHFDVENPLAIDFDVQSAWKNMQQSELAGLPTLHFSSRDEFRYLCLHGVRHRFARLSYLLDISMAAKRLDPPIDPDSSADQLLHGTSSAVALGRAMARRLYPNDRNLIAPAHASSLEQLADGLWSDLLTQPPREQNWASLHRFYLELETTPRARLLRRVLHLRILLTRLIDDDFRFAARFGFTRPWQAWILRPLRLVLRPRTPHKAECIW